MILSTGLTATLYLTWVCVYAEIDSSRILGSRIKEYYPFPLFPVPTLLGIQL